MNLLELLPQVQNYLSQIDLTTIPGWQVGCPFRVFELAQGEYNMNYRLNQGDIDWVLRVNIGTQIGRVDQIVYEYKTLRLLENTGVTPRAYFVDDSRQYLPYGILVMEYLPGETMDYRTDLEAVARLFARIHSWQVEENHLIIEDRPLSMTYDECNRLLTTYLNSEIADSEICTYLREVLDWAAMARLKEDYFINDPWRCIINTEVNSGNFIAHRQKGSLHLVDWEKPLWGDPSQDLSHFCVPTTTLWKTNYRMNDRDRRRFINAYKVSLADAHLRDTIEERVRLRDPFNCLRGISWSAMAWVAYQNNQHALKNEDTFHKINQYLQIDFLRSLFDPEMN